MMVRAFRKRWPARIVNTRKCVVEVRLYIGRTLAMSFFVAPGAFLDLPGYAFQVRGVEIYPFDAIT